jgi:methionyl-tRNA synthetase
MGFYVTTPIYYVNGAPHVGHAYTTIAADTITRWKRQCGIASHFLTGTDEHGQKVLEAAERRGLSPKAHCDDLVVQWKSTMERLHVRYDRFIRTTDDDHVALVQRVLQHLYDRGEIYRSEYRGWYLVKDEVFVTDKEREERIASGELPESAFRMIEESNWFFRMSKYQGPLLEHLRAHPDTIRPENRLNEVLGFLQKPLGDLCISRPKARMSWGIELPFDQDFVCYVWFDALLNYVTGAPGFAWGAGEPALGGWPADFQLLGKDILTTHAVYWTTMLLALGWPLPRQLFAHGWWVSADGQKMSKSLGNVIDVNLLVDSFGVDATRYFLLREIRFGADGQFSYQGFLTKVNADLSNDLGNLGHRTISMVEKWLGGVVPDRAAPDPTLAARAADTLARYRAAMDTLAFKEALDAVFDLVGAGNKHVDTMAPWALNKAGRHDELRAVMRDVLEINALAAVLLAPVLPTKAPELASRLGTTVEALAAKLAAGAAPLCLLEPGARLTLGDPLFPRFDELPPAIAALFTPPPAAAPPAPKEAPVSDAKPADAPLPEMAWIEFPDFQKVALRVGKVLEASAHPNADKLLVLKVDLGEARPRTICAGIKSKFTPEQLVGRNVVVVANLKPRVLRGVPSEGMILAAGGEEVVDLLSVNAAPGDTVR